jgi:hypothetical protein
MNPSLCGYSGDSVQLRRTRRKRIRWFFHFSTEIPFVESWDRRIPNQGFGCGNVSEKDPLIELLKDPLFTADAKDTAEESVKTREERVRKNTVLFALQSFWSLALTAIVLYYLVPALL